MKEEETTLCSVLESAPLSVVVALYLRKDVGSKVGESSSVMTGSSR